MMYLLSRTIFIIALSCSVCLYGQKQFAYEYEWKLQEDSLVRLAKRTIAKKMNEGDHLKEDSLAIQIVKQMLLKDKALRYNFSEENRFICGLSNPEKTFRIVTWFFLQAPGYIVYRGVVQFKGSPKLIPLFDQARFMEVVDNGQQTDEMNTPHQWYGAYYYDLVPYTTFSKKADPHKYLLMGKRQDHVLVDAKILDVLTVTPQQGVTFGDYFQIPKSIVYTPSRKRFVILHKKNVGTVLRYDSERNEVVFDMLDTSSEEEKKKINNKMFLIPTGLYHAFEYKEGMGWMFKESAFEQMTPEEFLKKKTKPSTPAHPTKKWNNK